MPQPTSGSMHQNVPLQNLTVQVMQDDKSFICRQVARPIPVEKQSDVYYEYTTGAWNRIEMGPRGSSEESHGSGWALSTTTYSCLNESVHKDVDWGDAANADPQVDPDRDSVEWLANQVRLRAEQKWGTAFFSTGIWTTDRTGVASGPTGTQYLQWDQPTADPQAIIQTSQATLQSLIGREGNTFIAGADLHRTLITNAAFRESVKYVAMTDIATMRAKCAAYLGMENYYVAGGFYNSAKEGQTATLAQILDADDGWLGYVDPNPGMKSLTAFAIFAWEGGGKYGQSSEGIVTRTFDVPRLRTTRYELDLFWDMKKIAADAGVFFDEATG